MSDLFYPESLKDALDNSWDTDSAISAIRFSIYKKDSALKSTLQDIIVLYMPETLTNPTNVSWDSQAVGAGGQAQIDEGFGVSLGNQLNRAGKSLDGFLSSLGSTLQGGSAADGETLTALKDGKILNPYLKMAFRGLNFRNFEYLFKFTPHTEKESKVIYEIIQTMRRAALPATGGAEGAPDPNAFRLEYPMEVQIEYLYQSSSGQTSGGTTAEHPWLNKFKKCVITDLSLNYTGAGFYASMRDGFPAQTELRLQFSEIDLVFREDVNTKEASF